MTVQGDPLTSQDRIWRMACILPASESGGKASLAEVPIPFPVCSVSGDWKTLCNKRKKKKIIKIKIKIKKIKKTT